MTRPPVIDAKELLAVQRVAEAIHDVEARALMAKSYSHAVVRARELYAFAAHEVCGASYPQVARQVGNRSHATVTDAAHRFGRSVDRRRDEFDRLVAEVAPSLGPRSVERASRLASRAPARRGRERR